MTLQQAKRRLAGLQASLSLPAGWTLRDSLFERVAIGGLRLAMTGFIAVGPGELSATGSAAGPGDFPVERAYFELAERIGLQLARRAPARIAVRDRRGKQLGTRAPSQVFPADPDPARIRRSLSNGVALHQSWARACEAAVRELVERDRVLRAFRGELAVVPLPVERPLKRKLGAHYHIEAYRFGAASTRTRYTAAGVALVPYQRAHPLVLGFGAGDGEAAAQESATREALQRLAFLWGEAIPKAAPNASPTPDFHQEYYLYPGNHAVVRRWLAAGGTDIDKAGFDGTGVTFSDLTPVEWRGTVAIAQARARSAKVLRFGAPRGTLPHPIA